LQFSEAVRLQGDDIAAIFRGTLLVLFDTRAVRRARIK
jgi:hypothetical protein